MTITGGKIKFALGEDSDSQSFETEKLYNDFKWHKIKMQWDATHFNLVLDGKSVKELSIGQPSFTSYLHLGGLPESRLRQNEFSDYNIRRLYFSPSGDMSKR